MFNVRGTTKTSRFSDGQTIIFKLGQPGSPVPELYRKYDIGVTDFYKWHTKFDGMEADLMARLRELD